MHMKMHMKMHIYEDALSPQEGTAVLQGTTAAPGGHQCPLHTDTAPSRGPGTYAPFKMRLWLPGCGRCPSEQNAALGKSQRAGKIIRAPGDGQYVPQGPSTLRAKAQSNKAQITGSSQSRRGRSLRARPSSEDRVSVAADDLTRPLEIQVQFQISVAPVL